MLRRILTLVIAVAVATFGLTAPAQAAPVETVTVDAGWKWIDITKSVAAHQIEVESDSTFWTASGDVSAASVFAAPSLAAAPLRTAWWDSGRSCGKRTYWTWVFHIPTRWTYQGTIGNTRGAHKHVWDGDILANGTIDYNNWVTSGWCADVNSH